jgi:hypothetical protein
LSWPNFNLHSRQKSDLEAGWPGWANFRLLGDWNYRSSPHFWATFFYCKIYVLHLTKNGLGNILGDFFTNSSCYHAYECL